MRRLMILLALLVVGVVAVAGIAYAVDLTLGDGRDTFKEKNAQGCVDDEVFGGSGRDVLRFNSSNERNCPDGDIDFGHGQEGRKDLVDVSDTDTMDTAGGGPGEGDKCIITVNLATGTRDEAALGCEEVTAEIIYNPQP